MENEFIVGAPLIECTLNDILNKHRKDCNADQYMVDYNRREARVRGFDNVTMVYKIDDIIEATRKEAKKKGYNLLVVGGMYA